MVLYIPIWLSPRLRKSLFVCFPSFTTVSITHILTSSCNYLTLTATNSLLTSQLCIYLEKLSWDIFKPSPYTWKGDLVTQRKINTLLCTYLFTLICFLLRMCPLLRPAGFLGKSSQLSVPLFPTLLSLENIEINT